MENEKYFELHIKNLNRNQEDYATGQLFSLGAAGVSEVLKFTQEDLKYEPQIVETETLDLVAYFESWTPAVIEQAQALFPNAQIQMNEENHKDWMEEWKKGYEPFSLSEGTWVVPSWKEAPPNVERVIYIDPGMAFGTGTHETTKVCSQLITKYVAGGGDIRRSVDIGTGTGILSILMEQLGFSEIHCSDIDPECRRVSRENFERNHVAHIFWQDELTSRVGEVDLIVANIIDGVLLQLKEYFLSLANPKTEIILSGILSENEEEFISDFLQDTPYVVHEKLQMKEWVGVWLKPQQGL